MIFIASSRGAAFLEREASLSIHAARLLHFGDDEDGNVVTSNRNRCSGGGLVLQDVTCVREDSLFTENTHELAVMCVSVLND